MILNTTYFEKEHKSLIEDIVGKSFSLWQSIKMRGIGSKRMIIQKVSPNMQQYSNKVSDINYANIELRPHGIVIYINKGLKNFTWVIPYYQLHIYKTKFMSIHAQGKFIQFSNNKTFKENKGFLKKMMAAKIAYDKQHNFINLV
ncbi:hypothetical protein LRR18_13895 [Mangrovimonas sp. AS39]|uniref:hypothetical protein n=2 Tax=Flavobacteriaceae TaxID=49546 RepID=UPI001423123D|nr:MULTISPECIES: hypothetical protein [Mangrovimonas]MCF1192684.1 hypothetical protein [Mangrovimonas futianensis]MCF1196395.1 hypothetical protein [Mangrovimonas futianensis]MCF1422742.1 hypothetical protein [Mangrovimonas futianensis]NIK92133.1 hypothetical protein [Mangrovimonas sp. CR14]